MRTTEFEDLLEAPPVALVGFDESGVIRFVNHHTESLFGDEREDLVGVPLETLVPESLRQFHMLHRRAYHAAPKTRLMGTNLDLSGRRRDGTRFPVEIALCPMDTAAGTLFIAAVRGLTLFRTGEADRDSTERLLAILEYSNDAIITTTLDGTITRWNPAAERIFGYSSVEIIGKSNELLAPQDRRNEMVAIRVKVRAGQSVEHLETMRVRKDGTTVPVSLTAFPVRDADGAVIGVTTIACDVTKQRQAFDAARSMIEASLDSLVAISPDGKITDAMFSKATRSQILLEARPDPLGRGDQKRLTTWVNRQRERLSGCDRDDVDSSLTRIDTGDVRLGHGGA